VPFKNLVSVADKVWKRHLLIEKRRVMIMLRTAGEQPPTRFYSQSRAKSAPGWTPVDSELNDVFPTIRPISVQDFVVEWLLSCRSLLLEVSVLFRLNIKSM